MRVRLTQVLPADWTRARRQAEIGIYYALSRRENTMTVDMDGTVTLMRRQENTKAADYQVGQ